MSADTEAAVDAPDVDQHTWKGLIVQPVGILVALAALLLWLATAELTEPRIIPSTPPTPRRPSTSIRAFLLSSTSSSAGRPCNSRVLRFAGRF